MADNSISAAVPTLDRRVSADRHSSLSDEKAGYDPHNEKPVLHGSEAAVKGLTHDEIAKVAATQDVGDVFEDVRAIDLDSNGNERPIVDGLDYSSRLISLEDDPTLRVHTLRMWFLGLGLACFGAVLGQLFFFRPQTIYVSSLFLQIFGYMLGLIMARTLPGPNQPGALKTADTAFWRFVNHGPFNLKEHVALTIMASTASQSALGISIFASQDLYYNVRPNPAICIFTLLGSQLVGYGLAGFMRIFLVYNSESIYPQAIPMVQLYDAMHRGKGVFLQKKRVKFFWGVFAAIFIWEWFPEYIAPTLTGISIFCLARQNSAWVSRIFGGAAGNEGLGLFSLCLDWNYIGSGGGSIGALFTPLSTQLALYAGCSVCIVSFCAVYAANTWNSQNYPFLSQLLFYENGTEYDQLLILNDDFTVNSTKVNQQGLPWFAGSQILYKLSRTMYMGAAITHVLLWHSKDLYRTIMKWWNDEQNDPHYVKMKIYPEVPQLWYAGVFVVSFAMAMGTIYGAKSGLPWWGLIFALILAMVFMPVIGTLYAFVGYGPSVQNTVQIIGGGVLPYKPVANMYFTLYGYQTVVQGYSLMQDLKIGQYTKLPPRWTFTVQMVGTVIGALLNYVIMKSVIAGNREILLDVQGSNVWSGQQVQAYNSAAITLGALTKELYSPGSRYWFVPFSALFGLAFPIPFWLAHRFFPSFGFNKVFTPILVAELGYLSVGINSSVFTSFAVAVFSQFYLRKYHARWFRKYNFLLSAALDGGTQIMVFIWSFAVGGASGHATPFPNWGLNPKGNPDYCKRLNH